MTPKPRILLVEDESGVAEVLVQFAAEPPALAVPNVGLPDLNNSELFRRLQALPGGKQVPMLFLTARSDEIDRVVGLELGADDYIAKPFSPRELVARVRTILRRSARPGVAVPDHRSPSSCASQAATHSMVAGRRTPPNSLLWSRAGTVPLRIRRAAPLGVKAGACFHARRTVAEGLGRCQ